MKTKTIIIWVIILALIGWGIYAYVQYERTPGQLDGFAQCLKDKGITFYGAFWCPHCAAQKAMFGKSVHLLPYVECSNPAGDAQLPVCNDKGIKSYPTWIFPDGSELNGTIPLADLAAKSGCALPQ